ncbi:hypothetical protein R3P38DRAFT_3046979 [Favolaschia claudopus]|uniref:Uncharacterized protein n=1 Tax=Favolaschia claudopus TaxID=2862362 RepID=A0AAW0A7Y7_9AGAR
MSQVYVSRDRGAAARRVLKLVCSLHFLAIAAARLANPTKYEPTWCCFNYLTLLKFTLLVLLLSKFTSPAKNVVKGLERRFNLICNEVPQCSVSDATACFNFLNALGQQACTVPGPVGASSTFCTAGGCHWFGGNLKQGGGSVSSFCSDVATGGASVIFGCSQSSNLVSGANAANGNGDLIVTISSES